MKGSLFIFNPININLTDLITLIIPLHYIINIWTCLILLNVVFVIIEMNVKKKHKLFLTIYNIHLLLLMWFVVSADDLMFFIWVSVIIMYLLLSIIQNKVKTRYVMDMKYIIPIVIVLYILIKEAYDYLVFNHEANDLITINFLIAPWFLIYIMFLTIQGIFIFIESKLRNNKATIFNQFNILIPIPIIILSLIFYSQANTVLGYFGNYDFGMEIKFQLISYLLVIIGVIGVIYNSNKDKVLALNLFNPIFILIIARYTRIGEEVNSWTIIFWLYTLAVAIQCKGKMRFILYLKYLIPFSYPFYLFFNSFDHIDFNRPIITAYMLFMLIQPLLMFIESKIHKNKDQLLTLLLFLISITFISLGIYYQHLFIYHRNSFLSYKYTSISLLVTSCILLFGASVIKLIDTYIRKSKQSN